MKLRQNGNAGTRDKAKGLKIMPLLFLTADFIDDIKFAPVYNFINGRLADKPTVLKPLS